MGSGPGHHSFEFGHRLVRVRGAPEDVLSRGFSMLSCTVPLSPKRVSQKTARRTSLPCPVRLNAV